MAKRREGRPERRGNTKVGCAVVAVVLGLLVLVGGGCAASTYNGMVTDEEGVDAAWSEVDNQYKRRYDLVPQLVETVKGAANFEKQVLTDVTEARASVGRAELPTEAPTDPAQLEQYVAAQQSLGGALQRLLVVAERYPELKASQNFLSLQDQLEGTENRIAVARRDYIDAVQRFNTRIRSFPDNFMAGVFGFEKKAQLTVDEGVRERPEIDFGSDEK